MMSAIQRRGLMAQNDPANLAEVIELMTWFSVVFEGGFHPEDNPREIVNADGPVFDEETAAQYDELMEAVWSVCNTEGVDPCEIALAASGAELAE